LNGIRRRDSIEGVSFYILSCHLLLLSLFSSKQSIKKDGLLLILSPLVFSLHQCPSESNLKLLTLRKMQSRRWIGKFVAEKDIMKATSTLYV
jgi:hypothetical protein